MFLRKFRSIIYGMPFLERDPWRLQYFEGVCCPDDVMIPVDDPDCWMLFPDHCWIYDKLRIAKSQGLDCAPHGVVPVQYPVFSKPIYNLKGMGMGGRPIYSRKEMLEFSQPSHMWMPLLTGEHISSDCVVVDGEIRWIRHATGLATTGGMFHCWIIHAASNPSIEIYLRNWVLKHMRGYTGMMNFESIGGRIIEAHLRFADQWCDLYGHGWIEALINLYAMKTWTFDDHPTADGFSIPLFARHGFQYLHPSAECQSKVRAMKNVSSLQITFYETNDPASNPMPPGGFRLAIINATDLDAGLAARENLSECLPSEQLLESRLPSSKGSPQSDFQIGPTLTKV